MERRRETDGYWAKLFFLIGGERGAEVKWRLLSNFSLLVCWLVQVLGSAKGRSCVQSVYVLWLTLFSTMPVKGSVPRWSGQL